MEERNSPMEDRYRETQRLKLAARREAEHERDAAPSRMMWINQDGLICTACKCEIKARTHAMLVAPNGVKEYTHHTGADCYVAMYEWRVKRRELCG